MKKFSLIMLALAALAMAGCSKKAEAQGVSSSGGSSRSTARANPATDFSYDLTEDGQGILIKGYTGGPGAVVIPATIEDLPVLEIGYDVFNGKSTTFSFNLYAGTASMGSETNAKAGITSITIPDTVRKIGESAFANTAITRFDMPDSVTEIGSGIFSGCENLTEIRLSDNLVRLVGLGGFISGLPSLKKANLPRNLREIKDYAFSNCGELTELVIPDSIQSVRFLAFNDRIEQDNDAFSGCSKLPLATRAKIQGWGYTGNF